MITTTAKQAFLIFVVFVFMVGCANTQDLPTKPNVIWTFKDFTNVEARVPGGGAERRYESRVGWIDVFVFSAGREN